MDNSKMIEALKNASLFDLYRLRVLISKILADPSKLDEARGKMRVNQEITYFDAGSNSEIKALIVNIGRNHVLVRNHHDGEEWRIPIHMVNIDGLSNNFSEATNKVDRLTIKVGERVGFVTKEGITLYGLVKKLNPRTATILVSDGRKWRVAYSYLFYIIEGNTVSGSFLEKEVHS